MIGWEGGLTSQKKPFEVVRGKKADGKKGKKVIKKKFL